MIKAGIDENDLRRWSLREARQSIQYSLYKLEGDQWHEEINNKPKLAFYKTLFSFRSVAIADEVDCRCTCSFLCKLIGGTLPLRIESGRYTNEPREERLFRL